MTNIHECTRMDPHPVILNVCFLEPQRPRCGLRAKHGEVAVAP
jgi:hypothetical protein